MPFDLGSWTLEKTLLAIASPVKSSLWFLCIPATRSRLNSTGPAFLGFSGPGKAHLHIVLPFFFSFCCFDVIELDKHFGGGQGNKT